MGIATENYRREGRTSKKKLEKIFKKCRKKGTATGKKERR